ncbi:MAG: LuxR C-terminal-related transcriptional regulator [Acidimicrobiales bacterium]
MTTEEALERGRESFGQQAWSAAFTDLAQADRRAPLGLDDLERLAITAYLSGREAEAGDAWTRAYHLALATGEPARAARSAFWQAFSLLYSGELAQGGGWLARASRILEERRLDCVEQGYLLVPFAIQALEEGDLEGGYASFCTAAEIAARFADADLAAFCFLGRGSALLWLGRQAEGLAALDEAMVSVTAGEVSAIIAGIVYCGVIEACWDAFDVRRAAEWTWALSRWCEPMPDRLPYRAQCLIHRAEILQLRGDWPGAEEEARAAGQRLAGRPAAGAALYQEGEVHRLRGLFAEAEEAYRLASEAGRPPHPGLARLRLAQGRVATAATTIRRVLAETGERVARTRLLGAFVDIMLAAGDLSAARRGTEELAEAAADLPVPFVVGQAGYAEGALLLAEGDATGACAALRRALDAWRKVDAPYEVARVRALLGVACRDLGDEDSGVLERDAAERAFTELGAKPDVERLRHLWGPGSAAGAAGGLTAREVEVLALVATGRTNKVIAEELVISEKTVARHLSNIFTKLGLTSRSAATAYAYKHGLV